ncbi:UNVERIFIED_CONTAM: hypothetical protein K2H54_041751 [Gekko kuhli]
MDLLRTEFALKETMSTGGGEDDIPQGERKTVTDFCYLLDKSKQLFNGLRINYIIRQAEGAKSCTGGTEILFPQPPEVIFIHAFGCSDFNKLFLCVFKHLFVDVGAEQIMQTSLIPILCTAQRN